VKRAGAVAVLAAGLFSAELARGVLARADAIVPPWTDPSDVPLPDWARSVAPLRDDTSIVAEPGHPEARRGTTDPSARLPLFGAKRAPGCTGRWLLVGPLAWICSDAAEISRDPVAAAALRVLPDGLPYRYFFVGADGAEAFLNPPSGNAETDPGMEAPENTLDPSFSVAIAEERNAPSSGDETNPSGRWGKTSHQKWIPMGELLPFRPSAFAGVEIADGALDFGWVTSDVALAYGSPAPQGKVVAKRARFTRVPWREERAAPSGGGAMVRISEDGATPALWLRARDLAHPTSSPPPDEVGGPAAVARWIDVDLGTQILVAYEGTKPVFATLVSTGRAEGMTPAGVHRVWVKLRVSDMENLADEMDENDRDRFSIEDVPYVQYFERGVALHAAFWHGDFGRPRSHGCVNLAPKDAAWLFGFTAPHLPAGWSAALPTSLEPGTIVRVRAGAFPLDPARGGAMHRKNAPREASPAREVP
jgi:lipoprotein-anchoring transpeptidase ErfK/SrfK